MKDDMNKGIQIIQGKEITRVHELQYELRVADVMTADVVTISPKDTMNKLRKLLRTKRISGIPVVQKGRLVGIVSVEDLINCLANGEKDAFIEQKMTRNVETIYGDEPLINAIAKVNRYGYGRLPVIEYNQNKLVGILTKEDIIKGLLKKLEIDYQGTEVRPDQAGTLFYDTIDAKMRLQFKYRIASRDISRAGESASVLKKTLYRLGFHPQVVRRAAIIAYEAEMNIVIFTNGGQIVAWIQPEYIKIKARDTGPGIADVEKVKQPGFSTAPEWVRELGFGAGMGIPNIMKCADKTIIKSEVGIGTEVETIIYVDGGPN
jgi:CBS domain-containing protein/anti-sigma regulatory factor (Ser/Thr protein kinase)